MGNFKSLALRDPEHLRKTLAIFRKIDQKLDDLRPLTHLAEALKRIDNTKKAAADQYKEHMEDLLKNWLALQEIGSRREAVADKVLADSKATAMAGVEQTLELAGDTVNKLSSSSTIMIVGLAVAILVGLMFAYVLTLAITKPAKETAEMIEGR